MGKIDNFYVPKQFSSIVSESTSLKPFAPGKLNQLSRIFNHLRRGGVALLSGSWSKILDLSNYVEKKKGELERKSQKNVYSERHRRVAHPSPLYRLMVVADGDGSLNVEPSFSMPYLLELLGDRADASGGEPFLVPVPAIRSLERELEKLYPISALGISIVAPGNVLPPRSQETISLIRRGLEEVKDELPVDAEVLDMGCGSGCLSLLAAEIFEDLKVKITATDRLPEALATTKLNLGRLVEEGKISSEMIEVTLGGDLFEPVGNRRFDLIVFNSPWVVSRPRTRAEESTHDQDQNTIRKFLALVGDYLKFGGHIILAYSDNSGQKAIDNLEESIWESGFSIENLFKDRIQTRRERGRWEKILVYDLLPDRN